MPLEMVRIDDRLIHGQVIAGWCPQIQPDHLILCNDEVARSEWECDLYRDAASGYKTSICSVENTIRLLQREETQRECVFLIVESPAALVRLADAGIAFDRVVIGGMHYQPHKRKVTDFVYVDDDDVKHFRTLAERGIRLQAMDVPHCKPMDLAELLAF